MRRCGFLPSRALAPAVCPCPFYERRRRFVINRKRGRIIIIINRDIEGHGLEYNNMGLLLAILRAFYALRR